MIKQINAWVDLFLKPFVQPVVAKLAKPLQSLNKLPAELIKKAQNSLKTLLTPKEVTIKQYVKFGRFFIAKRLLIILILAIILIVYYGFINPLPIVNEWLNRYTKLVDQTKKVAVFSGKARVYDADGKNLVYEGNMEKGKYSKTGVLYNQAGIPIYDGEFKNGLKNGTGIEYNDAGVLLYKGQFSEGVYSGQGTLYIDGKKVRYEGGFLNGKYDGPGTLYTDDAQIVYKGNFVEGKYDGAGKLYRPGGVPHYEGEFAAGQFSGNGKLFNAEGKLIYEGGFKNNQLSGQGAQFDENGLPKRKGEFASGTLNGEGLAFHPNGAQSYVGNFVKGLFNGNGERFDEEGKPIYKGQFVAGFEDGIGELLDAKGSTLYKGYFRQGQPFYPGFLGLSRVKLEELLGKPTDVTVTDVTGIALQDMSNADQQNPETASASGVTLSYPDIAMSFDLRFTKESPKEYAIEVVRLWGLRSLSQIEIDLKNASGKGGTGDSVVRDQNQSKVTPSIILLREDQDMVSYVMDDNYLFYLLYDREQQKLTQIEIERIHK